MTPYANTNRVPVAVGLNMPSLLVRSLITRWRAGQAESGLSSVDALFRHLRVPFGYGELRSAAAAISLSTPTAIPVEMTDRKSVV